MQNPANPSVSIPSIFVRLLIALILGLLPGLTAFYNPSLPSLRWLIWLPVIVLPVAMLLSIVFDPRVRQATITPGRAANAMLKVLLVIGAPILLVLLLGAFVPTLGPLVAVLVPLEVSLVAAFVVGSANVGLAIGCGLAAWLGAAILFLPSVYQQTTEPGNDFGSLVLGIVAVGVIIGFGVAALGSLLGRFLRRWALG
jgi:hypothetical protein